MRLVEFSDKSCANVQFYYKDQTKRFTSPAFGEFYSVLFDTDFYALVHDWSDLLYTLSVPIQILVFVSFDKKFKEAVEMLFEKNK